MTDELRPGDIVRETWPQTFAEHLNLYLGNGRFGACLDAFGLMNNGARGRQKVSPGNTFFMHADHSHRSASGLDYGLPLARLLFAGEEPAPPKTYLQELRIVHGYAHTELEWPDLSLTLVSYFHPARRDLFAFHISYEVRGKGMMPALLLAPETDVLHGDQRLTGLGGTLDLSSNFWLGRVKAGSAESVLGLRTVSNDGKVKIAPANEGCSIQFSGRSGRHLLLIGAASVSRREELCTDMASVKSAQDLLDDSISTWHKRWGDSEIDLPVPQYQALYESSHYYALASYAPEVRAPAGPMGWSGNGRPFNIPHDLACIHPALLRLGHLDIPRAWVEFYHSRLEDMQASTERKCKAEGAMWTWESPTGTAAEIHNAAHPARMAHETALHLRDGAWSLEVAWPIVRESARFYSSLLQKENDGSWGIQRSPSVGLDDNCGRNAKYYLCALYSAQYTLQTALSMGRELGRGDPDLERWAAILREGLAFKRLLGLNGIYAASEGLPGTQQLASQNHPPQLLPLTFLPQGSPEDPPLRKAYDLREEFCAGAKDRDYHGGTLAAFWLAASHARDPEGLQRELENAVPGRYVDKDWIQICESSGAFQKPYCVTSHGLYLQAINDALVSDYWGQTELGAACPLEWQELSLENFRTADGKITSGERVEGLWTWKET